MTLDELFHHGKDFAKFTFDAQGEVCPMWICETDEGKTFPIGIGPDAMGNKDGIVTVVRKIIKDEKAIRYVSMLEAWMVIAKNDKECEKILGNLDLTPVREHPERQEVVLIIAEEKYHHKSGYYFIIRPKTGKPYLSEFKDTSDSDEIGGRFMTLMETGQSIQ